MTDNSHLREEYGDLLCRCSFCMKSQTDVDKLVAGRGVYICNECVALCTKVIAESPKNAEDPDEQYRQINYMSQVATDDLAKWLESVEQVREDVSQQEQMVVDVMRSRRVSWAEIGRALGVTRQAAWQRFGAADSVTIS